MKFDELVRQFKTIEMTNDEKMRIRTHLLSIMNKNATPVSSYSSAIPSPWFHSFLARGMVLAAIVVVISGTGIVFASAKSLPGDTLYPIKVSIAENIRGAVIVDAASKAKWNGELIERRLTEIATLKKQNALTSARAHIAQVAFESNAKDFENSLAVLESEGKQDVAVKLTSSILPHFNDYTVPQTQELATLKALPSGTAMVNEKTIVKVNNDTATDTSPNTETQIQDKKDTEILNAAIGAKATSFLLKKDELSNEILIDANETQSDNTKEESNTVNKEPIEPVSTVNTTGKIQVGSLSGVSSKFALSGTLTGKVSVGPICPVEQAGVPCITPLSAYTSRGIIIYTNTNHSVVKEVSFKSDGTFETSLPLGTYILELKPSGVDRAEGFPKTITITSNQKTEVNISIDTGVR